MIMSHRHRFIFLHARKCAGSSVTAYLNPVLGPDDIQIGAWNDTLKNNGSVNRASLVKLFSDRHALRESVKHLMSLKTIKSPVTRLYGSLNVGVKTAWIAQLGENPAHATAERLLSVFPYEFKHYEKIAIYRNPVDYELSDYYWRIRKRNSDISFKEFLRLKLDWKRCARERDPLIPNPVTNEDIYFLKGNMIIDRLIPLDDIERKLGEFSVDRGFAQKPIPKAKAATTRKSHDKSQFITDFQIRELISQLHAKEYEYGLASSATLFEGL